MASSASYYLRVDIDDTSDESPEDEPTPISGSEAGPELTFVDLHTRLRTPHSGGESQVEALTGAIQDRLHLVSQTDRILFRWPWIVGPTTEPHVDRIDMWIRRLTGVDGGEPVLSRRLQVGVIQHRVASEPVLRWAPEPPTDIDALLCQARAVELEALLRRYNAIWEPSTYHYRLPSGEHTDVFIRVADAIHEPQDAYVMACWLSQRLRNGTGVVVDTGGLTPLLIQLESLLARVGFDIGPTAILPAYPTGRPIIRRTVEDALSETSSRIVAILSVSSTGTLQKTLEDELERVATSSGIDYTLDVIVDRTTADEPAADSISDSSRSVSWLNLKKTSGSGSSASCELCKGAKKTPFVAVDPRTYGAMALPSPHLVMPDIGHAIAGQLFWERVAASRGRAIEVNPHPRSRVARGKRTALPVRPIFELIAQPDGLTDLVKQRWYGLVRERSELVEEGREKYNLSEILSRTELVVASSHDVESVVIPRFAGQGLVNLEDSVRLVLDGVGLNKNIPVVTSNDADALAQRIAALGPEDTILVFSWGSVTGLTLRHLKLTVADALRAQSRERSVNGLLFHARPSTLGEWEAQQNQFRPGLLTCLWSSCYPWHSPLRDENRLLDRPEIDNAALSDRAVRFLQQRKQFLAMHSTYLELEDDWSPRFELSDSEAHPEHIFWGMSHHNVHQLNVRGRSLYGMELDCLSAYAAMGSVINYTRLNERPVAAPRWVLFDMGRIVRSYFDAVITCSILRWLQPGELWWGTESDDPDSVRDSVAFLLDQAADHREQVLLVPELLLASAQGKVPALAHGIVRERAQTISAAWPDGSTFDLARGAVEVGLWLLDAG